jgi:hypothetical protein
VSAFWKFNHVKFLGSFLIDENCTRSHIIDWLWECDDLGMIVNCIWPQWNGFRKSNYKGFEVLTAVVMKSTVFWDVTSCSPLKVSWCFRGLPSSFILVSCLAYLTMKLEAICMSEMSVDFQWITWCYIPEDSTLQLII